MYGGYDVARTYEKSTSPSPSMSSLSSMMSNWCSVRGTSAVCVMGRITNDIISKKNQCLLSTETNAYDYS